MSIEKPIGRSYQKRKKLSSLGAQFIGIVERYKKESEATHVSLRQQSRFWIQAGVDLSKKRIPADLYEENAS